MTEEGRSRGTFSALDALWILIGATVLVVLLLCLLPVRGRGAESVEVRYVLRVRDADPAIFGTDPTGLIPYGAAVYNENGTAMLGRVESIAVLPQTRMAVVGGRVRPLEETDAVILEIGIVSDAVVRKGDGVRIEDVRIAAGSVGGFRLGGYYTARAAVTLVELSEKEGVR